MTGFLRNKKYKSGFSLPITANLHTFQQVPHKIFQTEIIIFGPPFHFNMSWFGQFYSPVKRHVTKQELNFKVGKPGGPNKKLSVNFLCY